MKKIMIELLNEEIKFNFLLNTQKIEQSLVGGVLLRLYTHEVSVSKTLASYDSIEF